MLVVDASFVLSILLDELEEDEKIAASYILKIETLLAPTLLPLEVGNTILMKLKRGLITELYAERALRDFEEMDIAYFSHSGIDDLQSILTFSHRHNITFYDALYLKLALKMNCKLATFDKKMIEVAQTIGIEIL
jgi:predicted nucleic acid-binding protein